MLDAVLAEKTGIPAAAIITDRFRQTAQAIAATYGMNGYGFAVIAHPISHNNDAELRAKAGAAVQQCAALLTERSG